MGAVAPKTKTKKETKKPQHLPRIQNSYAQLLMPAYLTHGNECWQLDDRSYSSAVHMTEKVTIVPTDQIPALNVSKKLEFCC